MDFCLDTKTDKLEELRQELDQFNTQYHKEN